jgi:hypothetical protein
VCICVLNYCHRVATQLQLNISYHIASYHIVSYHTVSNSTWFALALKSGLGGEIQSSDSLHHSTEVSIGIIGAIDQKRPQTTHVSPLYTTHNSNESHNSPPQPTAKPNLFYRSSDFRTNVTLITFSAGRNAMCVQQPFQQSASSSVSGNGMIQLSASPTRAVLSGRKY